MAKRISDTERIIQYFMETPLDVAKTQLETVKSIVVSRQKSIAGTSTTATAAAPKRTRKATVNGAAAAQAAPAAEAPAPASDGF